MSAIFKRIPLSALTLWDKNPRTIKDNRFKALCQSLTDDPAFMELRPILATKEGRIYAGNMRYRAATELGWKDIPAIITDIDEKLANERAIKDNNEFGEWNNDELATLLDEMEKAGTDLSLLGLDDSIQKIIDQLNEAEIVEDEAPALPQEAKTKPGDLYILGEHRLLCGDATKIDDVERLMDGEKADLVFTDPPYGISIVNSKTGKVGAPNLAKNREYSEVIGDDTTDTAQEAYNTLIACGIEKFMLWGGNYFVDFLPMSDGWVIWDKRGDMNSNNFADGEMVWCSFHTPVRIYKQIWNGMIREGESDARVHPTQKPVQLLANIIKDFSNGIIVDTFGGSGSTLIACEQLGRKCYMMELDCGYTDVIIERYCNLTKNYDIIKNGKPYRWQTKS